MENISNFNHHYSDKDETEVYTEIERGIVGKYTFNSESELIDVVIHAKPQMNPGLELRVFFDIFHGKYYGRC